MISQTGTMKTFFKTALFAVPITAGAIVLSLAFIAWAVGER